MSITSPETAQGKVRLSVNMPPADQISAVLRTRIRGGVYPTGSLLPPTASLCREFGQPAETVKRAVRDLQMAGLVVRMPGQGVRVVWNGRSGGEATLVAQVHELTRLVTLLSDQFNEEVTRVEQGFDAATEALQNEVMRLAGELAEIRQAVGEALAALINDD